MQMEELLTSVQVATRLGMHPDQVHYHERKGRIPSVRIGRSVRFVESRIDRWLETGGNPTLNPPSSHDESREVGNG